MARLRANFLTGDTTDNPLTSGATQFNSPELSKMAVVTAPNYLAVSLDPFAVNGAPEIVWVTDHASGATVATISRHQESTLARSHPAGTEWANALTAQDFNDLYAAVDSVAGQLPNYLPLSGGTLTGLLALSGPPTVDLHAASKKYVDDKVGTLSYLPIAGGTMTGFITLHAAPTASMHAATKAYADTKSASNHNHSGTYAPASHTHNYEPLGHTHSEYAPTHSHPYVSTSANQTVGGTKTFSGTTYMATTIINGLGPGMLWGYNNVNGSIRWMGIEVGLGQSHGASSLEYKTDIEEIDLDKAVFARLDPIHFHYRQDMEFKDRWDDSWDSFENPSIGRMGFAYEQVEKEAPHLVYETEGLKAVAYEGMLPDFMAWTVAAINDLRKRVAVLEGI